MQRQLDDVLRGWEDTAQELSRRWQCVRGLALQSVAGFVDGQLWRIRSLTKEELTCKQANDGVDVGVREMSSNSAAQFPASSQEPAALSGQWLPYAAMTLLRSRLSDAARDDHGGRQEGSLESASAGSSPGSRSSEASSVKSTSANAERATGGGGRGEKERERGEKQQGVLDLAGAMKQGYGGAVSKAELGRCTWVFLHTLAAQFPENPSKQQQKDAKELMMLITRIYPCKECAEQFKELINDNPPRTSSGPDFSQWMCQIHNAVNRSIGKPEFPCRRVDMRWGSMDCPGGVCSLMKSPFRPK